MSFEVEWPWGKHEGEYVSDTPTSYLRWWVRQDWAPEWEELYDAALRELEDRGSIFPDTDFDTI